MAKGHRSQLKGRQPDTRSLDEVAALIGPPGAGGYARDRLIEQLHQVQDGTGALRERHLVALARLVNLPLAEVHEVASFYHHFDLVTDDATVPSLTVRVCDGLSCELAGGAVLLQQARERLGSASVRVQAVPCIGRCEQAPAAQVGPQAVACASAATLEAAVHRPGRATVPPVQAVGYAEYRRQGGYALTADLAAGRRNADAVLQAMEDSGLRGLGGAGFPAGRKWRIVRDQPAPRLMAVNVDEGEPGTFKDRHYLERDPHRFLEGLLVAARVVGIDACWVYVRDEYHDARALLANELARLQAEGIRVISPPQLVADGSACGGAGDEEGPQRFVEVVGRGRRQADQDRV